jgi:CMP-N,N'-diacetyllegionaminic acid synthase
MILGIVPARGGSKRLVGKNLRSLHGKPMIDYTIAAAEQCQTIDRYVVATEDEDIAAHARRLGAEVFKRPEALAQDDSSIYDTINLIMQDLAISKHDWIVLLQPTSPLRTAADIDAAVNLCISSTAPSCVSCEVCFPVPNGAIYVAYASWLAEHRNFDGPRTIVYPMHATRSVDVDTLADFERAERILAANETR